MSEPVSNSDKLDYTPTTEDIRSMFPETEATYVFLGGEWRYLNQTMFDRWLFDTKQDAWDEGYSAGVTDGRYDQVRDTANPYTDWSA